MYIYSLICIWLYVEYDTIDVNDDGNDEGKRSGGDSSKKRKKNLKQTSTSTNIIKARKNKK